MMPDALALSVKTEALDDIHMLLKSLAQSYAPRHSDFDDFLSLAYLAFCRCFSTYDGRSCFTTHVYNNVRWRLIDEIRERVRECESRTMEDVDVDSCHRECNSTRLVDLLDELSDDAKTVVRLILGNNSILRQAVRRKTFSTPRFIQQAISETLIDFGWTAEQIAASFKEITDALS